MKFLPENLKTRELCEIAVKQTMLAFDYVPYEFITMDMYILSIRNAKALEYFSFDFATIPEKLQTEQLYREFFHYNKKCLIDYVKYSNITNITSNRIKMLLNISSEMIRCIPDNLLTEEICRLAVEKDPDVLMYLEDKYRNLPCFKDYPQKRLQYDFREIKESLNQHKSYLSNTIK